MLAASKKDFVTRHHLVRRRLQRASAREKALLGLMEVQRRNVLEALLFKVQALRSNPANVALLLEIQEALLVRISRAERVIRARRARSAQLRAAKSRPGLERASSRTLRNAIDRNEAWRKAEQIWIEILRSVGDALAFIYADRFDLKPLAFRPDPGFLTGKVGARLERAILRRSCALGAPAILNDLTHTLRHGDITVFRSDGKFMLIEAKSGRGGKFARNQRQLTAARAMASYLENDRRQDEDGQVWQRIELVSEPPDYGDRVVDLANRLQPGQVLREEIEPGLHYVLVDCEGDGPRDYDAAIGFLKGRRILVLSANDYKKARLGYVPFALTLADPRVAARFYAGDFIVQVFVELEQVAEAFARRGYAFRMDDDETMPWRVWPLGELEATSAGSSATSFHLIGRLAAEFVTLGWLVESASIRLSPEIAARLMDLGAD